MSIAINYKDQSYKGKGAKKNPKCNLFPKGGEGVNPKVYIFKKFIYSEKEASKWISQECVLVSSESNKRSFGTPTFFFVIFVNKFAF